MKQNLLITLLVVLIGMVPRQRMQWYECYLHEHSRADDKRRLVIDTTKPWVMIQGDAMVIGTQVLEIWSTTPSSGQADGYTHSMTIYSGAAHGQGLTAELWYDHDDLSTLQLTWSHAKDSMDVYHLIRKQ